MNTPLMLAVTMTILSLDRGLLMRTMTGDDGPLSISFWADMRSLIAHLIGRAFTVTVLMHSLSR